jgi:hypothetical protein
MVPNRKNSAPKANQRDADLRRQVWQADRVLAEARRMVNDPAKEKRVVLIRDKAPTVPGRT